jgi:hypothetical protein
VPVHVRNQHVQRTESCQRRVTDTDAIPEKHQDRKKKERERERYVE